MSQESMNEPPGRLEKLSRFATLLFHLSLGVLVLWVSVVSCNYNFSTLSFHPVFSMIGVRILSMIKRLVLNSSVFSDYALNRRSLAYHEFLDFPEFK